MEYGHDGIPMSISTHLEQLLSKSLINSVCALSGAPPHPIIRIALPCSPNDTLEIVDDGDEATVIFGAYTHSHFGCYVDGLSQDQCHLEIAKNLIEFVTDVVSDRVLIWKSIDGRSGGWSYDFDLSRLQDDCQYLLWSRIPEP